MLLEITCADCVDLINKINQAEIHCKNVVYKGNLELIISISNRDYYRVRRLVDNLGGTVRAQHLPGIYLYISSIRENPVILIVILILLLVTLWVPRRVLFLHVSGNVSVSTNRILETAESCGLHFGVSRRLVRSEVIKNVLLQEIPQLQWVGVNTSGCVATISVKEKSGQKLNKNSDDLVCSIVAMRDGIIKECTVYQGNQLCTPGQAVKAGQILVSGYTDCGSFIKATRADAEIIALTFRDLDVLTPSATYMRGVKKSETSNFSVRIGKKVINLSKDSGNVDTGCVKIYSEIYARLPGGFVFPVSLIRETVICFEENEQIPIVSEDNQWLKSFAFAYLKDNMIAGDIASAQTEQIDLEGVSTLIGRFVCTEMIGQIKYEQKQLKD